MVTLVVSLAVACGPAPTPPPTAPTASVAPPTPTAPPAPTPTADPVADLAAALRAAWWPDAQLHPRQDNTYLLTLPSQGEEPPRGVLLLPEGGNTIALVPTPTTGVEAEAPSPAEGGAGGEAEPAPGELVVWSREEGVQAGKVVVELGEGGAPIFYFVPWSGEGWGQAEEISPEIARKLAEQGYIDPFAEALREQGLEITPATLTQLEQEAPELAEWLLNHTNPMSPGAYEIYRTFFEGGKIPMADENGNPIERDLDGPPISPEERRQALEALRYYIGPNGQLVVVSPKFLADKDVNYLLERYALLQQKPEGELTTRERQELVVRQEALARLAEFFQPAEAITVITPKVIFAYTPGESLLQAKIGVPFKRGPETLEKKVIERFKMGPFSTAWLPSNYLRTLERYFSKDIVLVVGEDVHVAIPLREETGLGGYVAIKNIKTSPKLVWPIVPLSRFADIPPYKAPDGTVYPNPALVPPLANQTYDALIYPRDDVRDEQGNPVWVSTQVELAQLAMGVRPEQLPELAQYTRVFPVVNPVTEKPVGYMVYFRSGEDISNIDTLEQAWLEQMQVVAQNPRFIRWLELMGEWFGGGPVIGMFAFSNRVGNPQYDASQYPASPNMLTSRGKIANVNLVTLTPAQVAELIDYPDALKVLFVHEVTPNTSAGTDNNIRTYIVRRGHEKSYTQDFRL